MNTLRVCLCGFEVFCIEWGADLPEPAAPGITGGSAHDFERGLVGVAEEERSVGFRAT